MTIPEALAWPPPFSVRISSRARHPRLRVLPGSGLEVVLPRTVPQETATRIVEHHKEWIQKTLSRMGDSNADTLNGVLPERVFLNGGTDERCVVCKGEEADTPGVIRLRTSRDNTAAALRELREWTRNHAAHVLGRETEGLAESHSLPYALLRFRRQKSRWGSCSAKGTLNLNICLIFLPLDMARHVIMHELAHTRHLNHGQGFWKLLFSMEPNALQMDKRLRTAWRFVPGWIWE